jgi:hypothetical protein
MQSTLFPAGRKGTLVAAFTALFALTPAAHAQTAAQPAQKAPAPVAAPASADDPAKVAAAREFLQAYRPNLNAAFVSAQMEKGRKQFAQALKNGDPKMSDADVNAAMAKRRTQILARLNMQLDTQSQVISGYFTLPELKALTAFFSQGVGKKLVDATPNIQMEMMRRQRVARGLPGSSNPGSMNSSNAAKAAPNSPEASSPQKK